MSRYIEEALKIRAAMNKARAFLTDEQALTAVELYPQHKTGLSVKVGEKYRYGNDLYKVIQEHVTQADWLPSITPALYSKVTMPGEIPDWAPGSWAKDVKVKHNGKTWLSMVNNNTWKPGSAGVYENIWKAVVA